MQRIDENTYIDDTLVTCAEYQLFIDEMREQGKYYQPDHWTSYQFPEGQAREPILGMRPSDANAFCAWLTQRENKVWEYRLLFQKEALGYPIKNVEKSHLGYWINEEFQFTWVGSSPKDARKIDLALDSALKLADTIGSERVFHFEHAFFLACKRAHDRALNLAHTFTLAHSHPDDSDLLHADTEDHETACARNLVLILAISHDHNLERDLTHAHDIVRDQERERDIGIACNRALDRNITHNRYIAKALDCARGLTIFRDSDIILPPWSDIAFAIILYIDLFTLQERIAGRSPAFEGIRLVKERTK